MQASIKVLALVALGAWGATAFAQDESTPQEPAASQDAQPWWQDGDSAALAQADSPPPTAEPAPAVATIPVQGAAEEAPAEAPELDTLTVTAQKRVQRLTDVPINVSAITRDDVRNARIEQVRDLASFVSNVDIKEQVPGAIPVVSIRGVGLDDFSSTNSPAAGIYVDQVTLSSLALMSFDLYDVSRIEVLKGPQGTLYGRNSTAGAINVLTATPGWERESYLRLGYGAYDTADFEGMYNQPLGDTLAVRVAGRMIRQDQGLWDSRVGENDAYAGPGQYASTDPVVRDIGLRDVLSGRARVAWQPLDALKMDLKFESLRQRSEMGQPEMFGTFNPSPGTCQPVDPNNCSDFLGYSDTDDDPYAGDYRGEFPYDIDQTSQTLLVDWDVGFGTLSSVTGRMDFDRFFHIDVDATPADEFDFLQGDKVEQLTQEVRLAGTAPLGDWLVGAFYGKDTITIDTDGLHQDLIPGETSHIDADQDTKSAAYFANMDWSLGHFAAALEKFTLTTGVRYTDEARDYVGGTTWSVTIPGTLDNTFEDSSIEDKNWSWKGGLNWKPAPAQLVFANVSRGVKSGGYFAGVTNAQNQLDPYEPEQLTAYEVGYKLGGPLSINTSAFYYDYQDKQTFMRAGGAAAQYIGNVSEAETRGFDFEVSWRALDGLLLGGGFGLLRTELGAFVGPVDADMDGNGDPVPAGNELPNSPELTWMGKVRYELPVLGRWLAAAQADAHYSDATFKEATNDPWIKSDAYTVINSRLSVLSAERTWEFALWGRNLTDELYVSQGLDIATFALGNRNYNAPRTFGAELSWNF
jgi:iron complex outermembrane recepter protein